MSRNHWMMFGTFAEQRYFAYPEREAYEGVIINGNMAAYAAQGIASFLLTKTLRQRYIIDPQTHAFQHDPAFVRDGNDVRKSIALLAEALGEPIENNVGKRPILPRMLGDDGLFRGLVGRCLDFEKASICEHMRESDVAKYVEFEGSGGVEIPPYALIAPYFYMKETTVEQWLPVNVKAAVIALKLEGKLPIFASLVVSQGVILDSKLRDRIVDAFDEVNVKGFVLWIDELDESEAGGAELHGLLDLASRLRHNRAGLREVIDLHGGYFSTLATGDMWGRSAFSAVCHGPEFGEHRSVVPVGGGIPIARYYIPALHQRIRYREAAAIFLEKGYLESSELFHREVCGCAECRETIAGNPGENFALFGDSNTKLVRRGNGVASMEFPTARTKMRCLQHYLQRKAIECQFAVSGSKEQAVKDFMMAKGSYEEVIGLEGVAHLDLWREVLAGTWGR